jgi:two-component system, cell cycle sensor histidine kinase and response regulator CckA
MGEPVKPTATAGSAIRVLLVEDSSSDAELLQTTLQQSGEGRFEFTWVDRLADALARLIEEPFDVLLLDLSLPDSSGSKTYRRAHSAAPGMPIVVLTGVKDESLGLAAVQEGVQDYLAKGEADGRQIARAIRYAIGRRHAEEQLRMQRELLQVTLASIGDAVLTTDAAGTITFLNPIAARLTGWPEDQAIGQPAQVVFHIINEQTREKAEDIVGRVLRERCAVSIANNTALLTRDGREVPIEDSAAPIQDSAGNVAGVVLVFHDVTEKRRAQEALEESESRLRTLLESASQGIVAVDKNGHMVLVNVKTEEMFGYTRGELLGQPVEVILPDRYRKAHAGHLQHYFANPHTRVMGLGLDLYGRSKNGNEFPLEVTLSYTEHAGSRLAMALITDITERKKAENRLWQAQKLESIGLLAGGVAHDFNNLLVGVIGNASLAQEMLPLGHEVAGLLQGVLSTGEKLAHLTRQMLAYSGKGRFVVEPLSLSDVIPEMGELVQPLISKKIALHFHLEPNLHLVEADRDQIQQVFMNLVLNAAEAIGSDAGSIRVNTGLRTVDEVYILSNPGAADLHPGNYVSLEVRDTGCGMDEATKAKIFDPFFTTKFTGRGLGLAAVSGIVRGHKGAITVSSAPGKGSCFTVLFPVAEGAMTVSPFAGRDTTLRGAGTILVVDDEEVVRVTARKALERYGYKVLVADGGLAAIDVFKRHPGDIALVVLDLSMPGVGGEEVLPELRKFRPGVKIVVSSGYSEADAMRLFAGQRVSGFLQKPFTPAGLAKKVKKVLA